MIDLPYCLFFKHRDHEVTQRQKGEAKVPVLRATMETQSAAAGSRSGQQFLANLTKGLTEILRKELAGEFMIMLMTTGRQQKRKSRTNLKNRADS